MRAACQPSPNLAGKRQSQLEAIMADTLRERFRKAMVVRGLAERTQAAYILNVELMVRRTELHPAKITDDKLRDYLV
jgi:hypothetical protein